MGLRSLHPLKDPALHGVRKKKVPHFGEELDRGLREKRGVEEAPGDEFRDVNLEVKKIMSAV